LDKIDAIKSQLLLNNNWIDALRSSKIIQPLFQVYCSGNSIKGILIYSNIHRMNMLMSRG
jgi:hypothetical protein